MQTTINIASGHYELEMYGCLHVRKNGQYWGVIEFNGGLGPVKQAWQDSAIENACKDLEAVTPEDRAIIVAAIKKIMPVPESPVLVPPVEIVLKSDDLGLIYAALMATAATSRDYGHVEQADNFYRVGRLFDTIRMGHDDYKLTPVS